MTKRQHDADDHVVYPNGETYRYGDVAAAIDAGTWPMSDDFEIVPFDEQERLDRIVALYTRAIDPINHP